MLSRTEALPATVSREPTQAVAGEGLLHPVALAAVLLLVVNDHVLKSACPSAITGKLSDFAGLAFFPLFLQALWEVGLRLRGQPVHHSWRVLFVAALLTAAVFTALQLSPQAADAYRVGLGGMQWPFVAGFELLRGGDLPPSWRVHLTRDVTDLIALPALAIPLWLGRARDDGT